MENTKLLGLLEKQRDDLYEKLRDTSISKAYRDLLGEFESGETVVLGGGEEEMLEELRELAKDTSRDEAYFRKLDAYAGLDNAALMKYFKGEVDRVVKEILNSKKQDEIQALFIEYDHYYHYDSCVICYGRQEYPIVEKPRYISGEYDPDKQVLVVEHGIDFQPAWVDCQEFEDLDQLEIGFQLEDLFRLHSRVLLCKALDGLAHSGLFKDFNARPLTFYINEHDCEVMTLYRLE